MIKQINVCLVILAVFREITEINLKHCRVQSWYKEFCHHSPASLHGLEFEIYFHLVQISFQFSYSNLFSCMRMQAMVESEIKTKRRKE